MQPGERGFDSDSLPVTNRTRMPPPGPPGCVGQEHGLAHARLAGDEQDLAGLRDRLDESTQPRKAGFPAKMRPGCDGSPAGPGMCLSLLGR